MEGVVDSISNDRQQQDEPSPRITSGSHSEPVNASSPISPPDETSDETSGCDDEEDGLSSDDDDSLSLNPNSSMEQAESQGIALLHQIFPNESTEALRQLHYHHLTKNQEIDEHSQEPNQQHSNPRRSRLSYDPQSAASTPSPTDRNRHPDGQCVPTSPLGKRILAESIIANNHSYQKPPVVQLPDDNFLRLPTTLAVRREYSLPGLPSTRHRYEFVADLEQQALHELFQGQDITTSRGGCGVDYFSRVVERDPSIGLGLTLREQASPSGTTDDNNSRKSPTCLTVVGFVDTPRTNPCRNQDIRLGDVLFGLNGSAFVFSSSSHGSLMRQTVQTIQTSPNPIVLHFSRRIPPPIDQLTNLLDTTQLEEETPRYLSSPPSAPCTPLPPTPEIHPFAQTLTKRGLIRSTKDEKRITQRLEQFTERARQWESHGNFQVDAHSYQLYSTFDPKDLPTDMANMVFHPCDDNNEEQQQHYASSRHCAPSTPPLPHDSPLIPNEYMNAFRGTYGRNDRTGVNQNKKKPGSLFSSLYPANKTKTPVLDYNPSNFHNNTILIPLYGTRKALSVRIVNTFTEEAAHGSRVAFTIWVGDIESGREWYAPIRYLADFEDLRTAVLQLATNLGIEKWDFPKHQPVKWGFTQGPADETTELSRQATSRQLEHFLRRMCSLIYTSESLHPRLAEITVHLQSFLGVDQGLIEQAPMLLDEWEAPMSGHRPDMWATRCLLKRSIQRYTWRLCLLNTMTAIISDFVDTVRAKEPQLADIEVLGMKNTLKERALVDLDRIETFLQQLVEMVIEGCGLELKLLASRRDFRSIHDLLFDQSYWDQLMREAVREQMEIEVYVPLRTVVSKLLVNGWRHEDMEAQFKIKELQKRPQSLFRIASEQISPSQWQTAADILSQGVGHSSLPCAKVRAIALAAREIARLFKEEHGKDLAGADDFLPIFIFCVVRAEMERPAALCVLLRHMSPKINHMGEIGYFLASFEAAILHIREIDLSEDRGETSFQTIPLNEGASLGYY